MNRLHGIPDDRINGLTELRGIHDVPGPNRATMGVQRYEGLQGSRRLKRYTRQIRVATRFSTETQGYPVKNGLQSVHNA